MGQKGRSELLSVVSGMTRHIAAPGLSKGAQEAMVTLLDWLQADIGQKNGGSCLDDLAVFLGRSLAPDNGAISHLLGFCWQREGDVSHSNPSPSVYSMRMQAMRLGLALRSASSLVG